MWHCNIPRVSLFWVHQSSPRPRCCLYSTWQRTNYGWTARFSSQGVGQTVTAWQSPFPSDSPEGHTWHERLIPTMVCILPCYRWVVLAFEEPRRADLVTDPDLKLKGSRENERSMQKGGKHPRAPMLLVQIHQSGKPSQYHRPTVILGNPRNWHGSVRKC